MARGAFRRRIMAWTEPGRAFAAIEDDLHHFRIDLRHDGEKVVAIGGTPVRVPWTSCPGAVDMLSSFVGEALAPSPGLRKSGVVASHQCTHMFDIVKIAMAQALRGGRRQYDIEVLDRIDTETRATIRRDGELVFSWDLRGNLVTGPATFAGHDIAGRAIWPEESVPDADALEAALVAAERFAAVPPLAFALTKAAMTDGYHTLEACFRAEQDYQPIVGLSKDHKESVAAFLEKRKPNYTGE